MNIALRLFSILCGLTLLYACGKDDPSPENEEELITTVRLTFTPEAGGASSVFEFKDLDGDGGKNPVITNGRLKKGTHYKANIEFLNEAESPAEDITKEVEEEGDEHQVFYAFAPSLGAQWSYQDSDSKGKPIGLSIHAFTPNAGSGNLEVTLRHQPNKNAAKVSDGDITNAGGETDVQVTFTITIE